MWLTRDTALTSPLTSEDISFNTILTAQTVEHLTPMTFDCQCSGTPYTSGDPTAPPSVTWLRDGRPIIDGDRFEVGGYSYHSKLLGYKLYPKSLEWYYNYQVILYDISYSKLLKW